MNYLTGNSLVWVSPKKLGPHNETDLISLENGRFLRSLQFSFEAVN